MNRLATLSCCTLLLAPAACAPEFDLPSEITSVRVLGVQKDKPYARPGERVELTLLDHDGSARRRTRPLQRLWLGGCENPRGDSFADCFVQFAAAGADLAAFASRFQVGEGSHFALQISEDIIERRLGPADPRHPPYGLAYVFFAVCAGEIGAAPPSDEPAFPLVCTVDGERLGQDDFVVGYTAVFVYEDIANANPRLLGFEVEGDRVNADCIGSACVPMDAPVVSDAGTESGAEGGPDGGVEGGSPPTGADEAPAPLDENCRLGSPRCIPICTNEDRHKCPGIVIRAVADRESLERDGVLAAANPDSQLTEQMWLNYYVDRGSVSPPVKLLADATKGWNSAHGTVLRAPAEPGPVTVWGVAHDNRGGTDWVRASFYARRP